MEQPSFNNTSFEDETGHLFGRIDDVSEFATIDSLVVKTLRKGHGTALFKKFEDIALKAGKKGISIEVWNLNHNAFAFWEHHGFVRGDMACEDYTNMQKIFK